MSMYNPNVSIPKTLVKFLVRWAAENEFDGEARHILLDIVATRISPELLPTGGDGQRLRRRKASFGPYELHDFFLFHFCAMAPRPTKSFTWRSRPSSSETTPPRKFAIGFVYL